MCAIAHTCRRARGTLVPVQVPAASGPWQANVRIRGDAGAVESDSVAAEGPTGELLGRPLVYRAASAAASPFRPASILYFRRTERVRLEWPVMKPVDEHTVRMLDRAGTPLTIAITAGAREVGGQPRISADITLAPLSNGDYLIELTARAGGLTERQLTALRVVYTR